MSGFYWEPYTAVAGKGTQWKLAIAAHYYSSHLDTVGDSQLFPWHPPFSKKLKRLGTVLMNFFKMWDNILAKSLLGNIQPLSLYMPLRGTLGTKSEYEYKIDQE